MTDFLADLAALAERHTDMTPEQIAAVAGKLTKAQRDIVAGHLVDIPPEEAEQLEALGLKGVEYWHEEEWGRRMIWPILPLGLAVRDYLEKEAHP